MLCMKEVVQGKRRAYLQMTHYNVTPNQRKTNAKCQMKKIVQLANLVNIPTKDCADEGTKMLPIEAYQNYPVWQSFENVWQR